jgi:hypothetical protein
MTVAESRGQERVTFSRGYGVCIMGIDGTWRRDCLLNAISDNDALLTVEGSIQGLNLTEFFLLLSSTGLAYRRCELVRVNGAEIEVQFLLGKNKKKGPIPRRRRMRSWAAEYAVRSPSIRRRSYAQPAGRSRLRASQSARGPDAGVLCIKCRAWLSPTWQACNAALAFT